MNLQRILIRVMLWMLAITAVAGVFTIFGSARVMGRVALTAGAAALAIITSFPLAAMLDRTGKRNAGLLGLGSVVGAFVLTLGAIWIGVFAGTSDLTEKLLASAAIIGLSGLVSAALLAGRVQPGLRVVVDFGCIAIGVSGVIFLAAVWGGFHSKLAETGGALLASCGGAALALVAPTLGARGWRWLGPLAALGAFVLAVAGIWFIPSRDSSAYTTLLCIAFAIGHANFVCFVPLPDSSWWLRLVAIGSASATAGLISFIAVATEGFREESLDPLPRVAGAAGIVAACSTIGVALVWRLNRPRTARPLTSITGTSLACPHCGKKFDARVGTSACPTCGLLVTLAVREPLCHVCQYPLLDLKSANCPECGTARAGNQALASDATEPIA